MTAKLVDTITPQDVPEIATPHMVAVRDGVRLATDVYLPEKPGKYPAILVRTPYDKTSRYTSLPAEAKFFIQNGYVFVTQDVRGKFRSEGNTIPYEYDVDDAYDTIDWIVEQDWSDGQVGLTGASYYGFTVWAGVASGHPAIRAAVPRVTGIEMGASHLGSNWKQKAPNRGGFNDLVQIWTDNHDYLIDADYASAPIETLRAEMESLVGKSLGVEELFLRARNCEHYTPYGNRHPYHTTDVPILHWVNWFDPGLAPSGMEDWHHFRRDPNRRHLHYLRAGSADHGETLLQNLHLGDEANPYISETAQAEMIENQCGEALSFFDEFMRGKPPATPRPRARWHVGNAGWQHSAEWPPAEARTERAFLTPDAGTIGRFAAEPAADKGTMAWTHDPENPVPSTTTIEEMWYFLAAGPDDSGLEGRDDILSFTTPVLEGDLDLAGVARIKATILADAPSMHVFAKLQDIRPDGSILPVSNANIVTENTNGQEPLLLNFDDVAYRFGKGHRLQLQICASNFPWFIAHPGTDENPWFATKRRTVKMQLETGGNAGALIDLPILSGSFPKA